MSGNEFLKVLLVGSDELLGDSMKMYFESKGYEVRMESTAEEVLMHLHQYSPDLIVSEHGRSSFDAVALFRDIKRRHLASASYRVIICDSGNCKNLCNDRQRYADICIAKPLTGDAVNRMLNQVSKHPRS